MEKKVLVLDIDGTLTNSKKEITDKTRHAIWDAVLRGHKVMLASGRPTPGMRRYEEELELARYADICCPSTAPASWNAAPEK